MLGLEERGYHLEKSQRDLTTLQKLFLALGSPVYAKYKRIKQKEFEDNFNSETDPDHEESWKDQYLERKRQNAERERS